MLSQSGRGHGSDAVMLEVRSNAIEAGVQLALQRLVHPQQKWNIRKDVQVQSPHLVHAYVVCSTYWKTYFLPLSQQP